MKKLFLAIAFTGILAGVYSFVPNTPKAEPTTFNVVTSESKVEFVGSKKAGYHTGSFALKSGTITTNEGKLTGGKFLIDLNSVKSDGGEKLDGHLKSADFFDVAKFGEAAYEITGVKYADDNTAQVSGNLSLKGLTLPVSFNAKIRNADDKGFFAQANFSLDRTLFGLNYGIGMISPDVQISVYLFGKK